MVDLARGRLVGGCSAVNATFALRRSPADYDRWAATAAPGWSWEDVLPAFRHLEADLDFGGRPWHGRAGPVPIRRYPDAELGPGTLEFLTACEGAGHPLVADHNEPGAIGAGRLPVNAVAGVRQSAALTHLAAARGRANLMIRPNAHVDRLYIQGGTTVRGVVLAGGEVLHADHVVLAAGAYASPAILLRSGVGPADDLRQLSVPVVADVPGVGANLQDHPAVTVAFQPELDVTRVHPAFQAVLTLRSSASRRPEPDLQIVVRGHGSGQGIELFAALLRPESRGRVELRDLDPLSPPRITTGFLMEPGDRTRLAEAVRCIRELAAARSLLPLTRRLAADQVLEWSEVLTAAYLDSQHWSYFHPVGTCAMGSVVDTEGRLVGVDRLHVIDASILPDVPSANTNLATMMAAERCAAAMAEGS